MKLEMKKLEIEIKAIGELSQEINNQIQKVNNREFGNDSLVYDNPELYILGFLDGIFVAQVAILQRTIKVNRAPLRIGGVCYLVTASEYRGNGFGSALMKEAISYLTNELILPFGLLTCRKELEKLYMSVGYKTVIGPTLFDQADGIRNCKGLTMVVECGGKLWSDGEIDLCGLPW